MRLFLLITILGALAGLPAQGGGSGCAGKYSALKGNSRAMAAEDSAWNEAVAKFQTRQSQEPELRALVKELNSPRNGDKLFGQRTTSFELNVRAQSGVEIIPRYDPRAPGKGLIVQINVGKADLKNPVTTTYLVNKLLGTGAGDKGSIFDSFGALNGNTDGFFPTVYDWAETHQNASLGSKAAQSLMRIWDNSAKLEALNAARLNERAGGLYDKLNPEDVSKAFAGFQKSARPALLDAISGLKEEVATREKTLTELGKKKFPAENLQALVAANDRQGVANLLSNHLPWSAMQPTELRHWERYLEAIRKPGKEKALLFRGFSGQTQLKNEKQEVYAFSPFFGSETSDAKSLAKLPQFFARAEKKITSGQINLTNTLSRREAKEIAGLPTGVSDLMEAGLKHLSLNLSYNPWLSYTFATSGKDYSMGAFLIDKRRVQLNLTSPYVDNHNAEREVLAPFLLFPDEVLHYEEGQLKANGGGFKPFLRAMKEKLGKRRSDRMTDQEAVEDGIGNFARSIGLAD